MTARLATAALLDRLSAEGELLAAAMDDVDRHRRVDGLDWTVRDVVVHTGAVHRWAADIVARALASNETGGSRAFHPDLDPDPDADPDDTGLTDWFRSGHADLVATLREAPDDLEAWTLSRGAPAKYFWTRRQAHETAIHRVDVESVGGPVTDVPADFAQDGIHELAGFARNRAFATDEVGSLLLAASDGASWSVRFGGERITTERTDDTGADAVVSGRSSDLYRWLWNRPSPAVVRGDAGVADLWRRVTI